MSKMGGSGNPVRQNFGHLHNALFTLHEHNLDELLEVHLSVTIVIENFYHPPEKIHAVH